MRQGPKSPKATSSGKQHYYSIRVLEVRDLLSNPLYIYNAPAPFIYVQIITCALGRKCRAATTHRRRIGIMENEPSSHHIFLPIDLCTQ